MHIKSCSDFHILFILSIFADVRNTSDPTSELTAPGKLKKQEEEFVGILGLRIMLLGSDLRVGCMHEE